LWYNKMGFIFFIILAAHKGAINTWQPIVNSAAHRGAAQLIGSSSQVAAHTVMVLDKISAWQREWVGGIRDRANVNRLLIC
jgi:hypothetical protein